MKGVLPRSSLLRAFARSFLIQGSWNYHTMLGTGFAFAVLPALRRLYGDRPQDLEVAIKRHLEHFNAHPYLAAVALGAALKLECDQADDDTVRRFKTAVRGPLGGVGDALVWASWLPVTSLLALAVWWLGAPGWVSVVGFLGTYNAGHLTLRWWGFRTGLRAGRAVGPDLAAARFGVLTQRLRRLGAVLLGVLAGAALTGDGGLWDAGALWTALAFAGFAAGLGAGHRVWRPTAVVVVAAVAVLTAWGWTAR